MNTIVPFSNIIHIYSWLENRMRKRLNDRHYTYLAFYIFIIKFVYSEGFKTWFTVPNETSIHEVITPVMRSERTKENNSAIFYLTLWHCVIPK